MHEITRSRLDGVISRYKNREKLKYTRVKLSSHYVKCEKMKNCRIRFFCRPSFWKNLARLDAGSFCRPLNLKVATQDGSDAMKNMKHS